MVNLGVRKDAVKLAGCGQSRQFISRRLLSVISPISYLTARPSRDVVRAGHQKITKAWWEKSRHAFDVFVSDFVVDEAMRGDPMAVVARTTALTGIPLLATNEDAVELAERLIAALKLPRRARLDAFHLALATIHEMSYLLTWNCRHLANGILVPKIEKTCRGSRI